MIFFFLCFSESFCIKNQIDAFLQEPCGLDLLLSLKFDRCKSELGMMWPGEYSPFKLPGCYLQVYRDV